MTCLLDVNVLVALLDDHHVFHDAAHDWFAEAAGKGWATCPLTENGAIRILGHSRYPGGPGSPAAAAPFVEALLRQPGHVFWPDGISLVDCEHVRLSAIAKGSQVTDTYLLALAVHHGGRLATFDRRLSTAPVAGGAEALLIIG